MENSIAIILIIFGILQIVLVLKIWFMTNDVKVIKKALDSSQLIKDARILYLKGKLEQSKDILDTAFFSEMLDAVKNSEYMQKSEEDIVVEKYASIYKSLNFELPNKNLTSKIQIK